MDNGLVTLANTADDDVLPNLLAPRLRLIFCGMAAGPVSAMLRQYYAGPGYKFWKVLAEVGLIPDELEPCQYRQLLSYGIGLTDLVKARSGVDAVLSAADMGTAELRHRIECYQPRYLCFNGKRVAEGFLRRPVSYGLQAERIGATAVFVAPSTSGAANRWWSIVPWQELARLSR